jgi:hypothetical protein
MMGYGGYGGTAQAAPVKVGLGRSNIVVALAVLGFLGWAVWAGAHGAWTSDSTSAKAIGYGVAAAFGVALVMMLVALPRLVSPRYVMIDAFGLRIRHGRREVVLPWPELLAVGIGYQVAPEEELKLPTSVDDLKDAAKEYMAGKASEALQVSGKRRLALEIFPIRPDAVVRYPRLKPYWQMQPPPRAGLPLWRWRFPLPPVVSIAETIGRGIYAFTPQRWLGWFPRPWSEPGK